MVTTKEQSLFHMKQSQIFLLMRKLQTTMNCGPHMAERADQANVALVASLVQLLDEP
jgi:hypothetical protein